MHLETYLVGSLTLDLLLKIHLDNKLSMWRVKMNFTGAIRLCQTKIDQPKRQKMINMIEG